MAVIARGLRKQFGDFTAVDGIDLDIPAGVCFGLLGPNGAGKTTTIRMMQGVSPLSAGSLQVLGMDVVSQTKAVKARLGVVPQEDNLDPDFTVRDNLLIYARFFGIDAARAAARADELLAFLNLTDKADGRIDELSGGMKRRLIVARALINDPDLLVLDEPTTGLDPQARHSLWETIRRLRRQGKTILLTTHYMDEAEMLCDELVIIDQGRIHEQGRPKELIAKHCGKEAAEFVVDDRAGDPDHVAAILDDVAARLDGHKHERLGDRIIAYGDDLAALQERIHSECDITEASVRRAGLEDVFLRLTGRALRD